MDDDRDRCRHRLLCLRRRSGLLLRRLLLRLHRAPGELGAEQQASPVVEGAGEDSGDDVVVSGGRVGRLDLVKSWSEHSRDIHDLGAAGGGGYKIISSLFIRINGL